MDIIFQAIATLRHIGREGKAKLNFVGRDEGLICGYTADVSTGLKNFPATANSGPSSLDNDDDDQNWQVLQVLQTCWLESVVGGPIQTSQIKKVFQELTHQLPKLKERLRVEVGCQSCSRLLAQAKLA